MWETPGTSGARRGVSIRHCDNRKLYRYWDRLRGDRPAPMRHEIEPASIGSILSDTFVLEATDDRRYAYRLAGTRVCGYFGRELKGENWLHGWEPRAAETLAVHMRAIVNEGAGALVQFTGRTAQDHACPFETLMLPLVNRGKGYTRILGATLPLDDLYWLGAYPVVSIELVDAQFLWPNNSRHFRKPARGNPQLAFPVARRGHLAVYDGGRND